MQTYTETSKIAALDVGLATPFMQRKLKMK